jgi:hypothetical protein
MPPHEHHVDDPSRVLSAPGGLLIVVVDNERVTLN